MVSGITSANSGYAISYSDIKDMNTETTVEDESIFETVYGEDSDGDGVESSYSSNSTAENAELLYEQLEAVEDEQGVILNAWNDFKEFTNIGTSVEKCDAAIEQYKNGEISYEEAAAVIDNFDFKQESSLNLFSNIVTSAVAIAAGACTGGLGAIVVGAAAGAATKAGFKTIDRATNDVEGDALDAKQILQDAASGAVTGGVAVATAGTGANTYQNGIQIGSTVLKGTAACAVKSSRTGIITGSISSAANYMIDCTFDDDKDFNAKELMEVTATGAAVGGTVGAIMGTANGVLRSSGVLQASDSNTATNSVCSAEYKILNDRLRSAAA